jgi:hypothetical protein
LLHHAKSIRCPIEGSIDPWREAGAESVGRPRGVGEASKKSCGGCIVLHDPMRCVPSLVDERDLLCTGFGYETAA